MPTELGRNMIRTISPILWDGAGNFLTRFRAKDLPNLERELAGAATNELLNFLLGCMDIAFIFSNDFRKNIENFEGRYLFENAENEERTYVFFKDGKMKIADKGDGNPHARLTFKDANSLRAFIMSGGQDILDAVLNNKISIDGNLNYIYKFGFISTDLLHRLNLLDLVNK